MNPFIQFAMTALSNHCIIASLPSKRWIWPPQKQQYHSKRTRSRHTMHSKLQYVVVPTCFQQMQCLVLSNNNWHCIFHSTIWFLWRLSLPHWTSINQQYLPNFICNCCRLLTDATAMAYPQAAAIQSLLNKATARFAWMTHTSPTRSKFDSPLLHDN